MTQKNVDLSRIDVTKRPLCGRCGLVLLAGSTDWYCLKCEADRDPIRRDRRNPIDLDSQEGMQ